MYLSASPEERRSFADCASVFDFNSSGEDASSRDLLNWARSFSTFSRRCRAASIRLSSPDSIVFFRFRAASICFLRSLSESSKRDPRAVN